MQLRRSPPHVRVVDDRPPPFRLPNAPAGAPKAPGSWTVLRSFDGYSVRAVAGVLLVSIPISIFLGFVMSNWIADSTIGQAKASAVATAQAVDTRVSDWVGERKAELRAIADDSVGSLDKPWLPARLLASDASHPAFENLQILNTQAKVVASTRPGVKLPAAPSGPAFTTSLDYPTLGPIQISGAQLDWLMTAPIRGPDGTSEGMVMGDLDVAGMGTLFNPYGDKTSTRNHEVHVVNDPHLLIFGSEWGIITDDPAGLAKGTLNPPAQ